MKWTTLVLLWSALACARETELVDGSAADAQRIAASLAAPSTAKAATAIRAPGPLTINIVADGFDQSDPNDRRRLREFLFHVNALNGEAPFNAFNAVLPALSTGSLKVNPPNVLPLMPSTSGAPAAPRPSALGLIPKTTPCYFDFRRETNQTLENAQQAFLQRLEAASSLDSADLTIVVLNVGNEPGVGACALQSNLILTAQGLGSGALAHELGHAIGLLHDESDSGHVASSLREFENCATPDPGSARWILRDGNGGPMPPVPGCNGLRQRFYRPQNTCRMLDAGVGFDPVCTLFMLRHLSARLGVQEPPHPATAELVDPAPAIPGSVLPQSGTYVTADYYDKRKANVVATRFVDNVRVRPSLLIGSELPALVVDGTVIGAVALPDPVGMARAYPPDGSIDIKVESPLPTRLTFFAPGLEPGVKFEPVILDKSDLRGTSLLDQKTLSRLTDVYRKSIK